MLMYPDPWSVRPKKRERIYLFIYVGLVDPVAFRSEGMLAADGVARSERARAELAWLEPAPRSTGHI